MGMEPSLNRLIFRNDLHAYDMEGVPMTKHGVYHHLRVPGLAEKRPSVVIVKRILSLPPGASAPFILFGPPGTGKTVTIVEAIKQILRLDPIARLLVCAPSNSAADIIAQRLSGTLGTNSLFRFYAPSRERKTVPADEAGQATEPETMVAVKNIASATTKVVLSGDPKQLRPIVRSAVADALGLGISYLERLMERDAYRGPDSHGASSNVEESYVKLLKNYRSHHEIIRFPSARFYNEELEPCGEATSINSCLNLTPLVLRKFPVIFCSVAGQDMREASSPSFFNPQEAMQCQKLRAALRQIAPEIKVGSVEEFQGDERRIIIITTVRSSRDFVSYDLRYTLGFVANPRRFNVAVTRAKALLIVVGDPLVLGLDPLWRAFLNSVHAGGGWRGQEIPWDPLVPVNPDGGYDAELRARAVEDADALAQRLLEGAGDPDAGEDQPFRELEE
ncbi:P-loop containing nucleoside triphosphate hydrolase protein [Gloeopeniophorella convolvens]|nr:P-loop containing nucleoside triphosphate hydrolase protein [Gloeopeniophorella convolvens]